MSRRLIPVDIPPGVEVAAHRFAAACKQDGWKGCVVMTCGGGTVDCISNSTIDGNHVMALMDGAWYEWKEIGE